MGCGWRALTAAVASGAIRATLSSPRSSTARARTAVHRYRHGASSCYVFAPCMGQASVHRCRHIARFLTQPAYPGSQAAVARGADAHMQHAGDDAIMPHALCCFLHTLLVACGLVELWEVELDVPTHIHAHRHSPYEISDMQPSCKTHEMLTSTSAPRCLCQYIVQTQAVCQMNAWW